MERNLKVKIEMGIGGEKVKEEVGVGKKRRMTDEKTREKSRGKDRR